MAQCRVCLEELQSPILLESEHKKQFLHITGIELNETINNYLCKKCMKQLSIAWDFRLEALNADHILRNHESIVVICDSVTIFKEEESIKTENEIKMEEENITQESSVAPPEKRPSKQNNPFICDFCDARFTGKRNILNHIKMHRRELGKYCRFCDKVFTNYDVTKKHEEKKHTRIVQKPLSYVCETCGKAYSDLRQLRLHSRIHADSYKCTFEGCTDAFTQKRLYYSHFATKHGIKQPCECTECGKTFSNHLTLKNHRRLFHNEGSKVSCPECSHNFLNKGQLERHIESTHRGERKHQCTVCPKNYGRQTHLKRHYRDSHYDFYLELLKTKTRWKL